MCGIFGYVGKEVLLASLLEGLLRLEYRGYDSCGVAAFHQDPPLHNKLFLYKRAGKINQLQTDLEASLGQHFSTCILHTRWATHGKPDKVNSHPHTDCQKKVALVHNGIIENYLFLKEDLIRSGHRFVSGTDTEVIVHLIEQYYCNLKKPVVLEEAVSKAVGKLKGSFALAIVSVEEPEKIVVVRKDSPLIIGVADQGVYLASGIPALLPFTRKVMYLNDGEMAVLNKSGFSVMDFKKRSVGKRIEQVRIKAESAEKKGFAHFMLKEIFQQPEVLRETLRLYVNKNKIYLPEINFKPAFLEKIKKIYITACGTAFHAGYIAKYFLEKYCTVDVEIETSSEFRYRNLNARKGDLLIAISQSGETADTLAAVKEARRRSVSVLSICNALGSSLVKESDGLIYTPAGPEIGVASTKAYTAQIFALYLFALYLAQVKKSLSDKEIAAMLEELKSIPLYQEQMLENVSKVKRIAKKFSKFGCFLFLGRGINFPSALEGALKLKEISYVPAEGYPAGEMKHGPIALIDEYRAVVCIAVQDNLYEKMVSNIQEIKARKGKVFALINGQDKAASSLSDDVVEVPRLKCSDFSPLLVAVYLQMFAYFVAKNLGCEIDQPRNLAKSVTVE